MSEDEDEDEDEGRKQYERVLNEVGVYCETEQQSERESSSRRKEGGVEE